MTAPIPPEVVERLGALITSIPQWGRLYARYALEAIAADPSLLGPVFDQIRADALREAADMFFYDGDADEPLYGYAELYARADEIAAGLTR